MNAQTIPQPILTPSALPGNVALYGTVQGRFAFIQAEAAFVQSLLPPDLELAPQQFCPQGYHPLLLMFNYTHLESNSTLERIAQEYKLGLNLNYNEFIVMLPFVQFKNSAVNEGPYCFLPVLYLDSILAVLGGRIFWEFNKVLARFNTIGVNFNVLSELTNSALFTTEFGVEGAPVLDSKLPNFESIIPILSLPVLEYGLYGYVTSIYTVEYENQMIIPSVMNLNNISCKYMPGGLLSSPSILQNVLGCFNLTYNWTLTYIKFIKP
jgi:hypothetical protein